MSEPKRIHKKPVLRLHKADEETDIWLERLDSVLDYVMMQQPDEECEFEHLRVILETNLIIAKQMYIAWRDEEY
jgi:hypothetical protein